jgi:hypothetical protein
MEEEAGKRMSRKNNAYNQSHEMQQSSVTNNFTCKFKYVLKHEGTSGKKKYSKGRMTSLVNHTPRC